MDAIVDPNHIVLVLCSEMGSDVAAAELGTADAADAAAAIVAAAIADVGVSFRWVTNLGSSHRPLRQSEGLHSDMHAWGRMLHIGSQVNIAIATAAAVVAAVAAVAVLVAAAERLALSPSPLNTQPEVSFEHCL